jgi:hypothetical protein
MSNIIAKNFFEKFVRETTYNFRTLPQSGSGRINFIGTTQNHNFIITQNENIRENEAFFYFSNEFAKLNLNTPKILAINENKTIYIQEFLGENTLSEIISREGHTEHVKTLVKKTLIKLFDLQQKTQNQIDFSKSYEYEVYDELPITHDLYYFKNFLVDILEIPYHKSSLLKEFKKIISKTENLSPKTLMLRDFQARNIIINEQNNIFFIDYQSAMQGIAMYDVVSFIYQAKANFPIEWKSEMLKFYIRLWDKKQQNQLWKSLPYCQLIRFLQVLGAYGFRGIVQKKSHFLKSLDQGIKNIYNFFENWEEKKQYPELYQIILKLSEYNHNFTENNS